METSDHVDHVDHVDPVIFTQPLVWYFPNILHRADFANCTFGGREKNPLIVRESISWSAKRGEREGRKKFTVESIILFSPTAEKSDGWERRKMFAIWFDSWCCRRRCFWNFSHRHSGGALDVQKLFCVAFWPHEPTQSPDIMFSWSLHFNILNSFEVATKKQLPYYT